MKATVEIDMPKNCSDCDLSYLDWHLFCPIRGNHDTRTDGLCPNEGRREDCPLKTVPIFFSRKDMETYYPEE